MWAITSPVPSTAAGLRCSHRRLPHSKLQPCRLQNHLAHLLMQQRYPLALLYGMEDDRDDYINLIEPA
ncbi:hypothetical protein DAI22_12g192166 [Oryza sativa Japonica Group]|nr:hypothetical protein DAI22_12g192166 [Oryza sativa Japonica Group]